MWGIVLSLQEATEALREFNFETLNYTVISEREIIPSDLLMNFKVQIKSKNIIWVIHKYDKDPFPSNPHAHNMESSIKLDLTNGDCYKGRKLVYRIKQKALLDIRKKAIQYLDLPPLDLD